MASGTELSYKQKVERVRDHLKEYRDNPAGDDDALCIDAVAKRHGVDVATVRQFRDGADDALNQTIVMAWSQLIGQDADLSPMPSKSNDEGEWYQNLIREPENRTQRLYLYDRIDRTRNEASSALDAWADIVTTGSITTDDNYLGGFEPETVSGGARVQKAIAATARTINDILLPTDEKWKLVRDMVKFGEQFEQIGIAYRNGQPTMVKLVNMPVATMRRNILPDGTIPPDEAYHQVLAGRLEPSQKFPQWKIAEFANVKSRSNPEGISIFRPGERSLVQTEAIEASMVIRAVDRASLRYKHTIDVSHTADYDEQKKVVSDYRRDNTKIRTVDGQGRHGQMKINLAQDADFIIAKRGKDSPADVDAVEGDPHMDQTGFYTTFQAKWLCGLGPPKAHLGYEDGVGRSVLTDQHIVFARKGRRMQMKFIAGLRHLYWVDMLLKGIDPRSVSFVIWPPDMGTKDEVMRAQVQLLQATTIRYLCQAFSTTGQQPSIKWCLKYLMGMDDEVIGSLELSDVVAQAAMKSGDSKTDSPNKSGSAEMAAHALLQPEVQHQAGVLQFLVNERAIRLRKTELMSENDKAMIFGRSDPFNGETVSVAKHLYHAMGLR